ncbi:MAG: riboflavin synthase [Pseudomonadota bacterium]|jgi:riboflavin synthase|uniref:riboflavin synthase n=1 Tax=Sandarakinorhabdus limnophila TaxID=210512 RepID=UPI0026EB470C|nr:riboflavin synthase [Sandarakinorhabdus limnophila]
MFTGIITDIGTISAIEERGDLRVTVQTGYDTTGIAIGASVANSGVCLTVVSKTANSISFDVSAETLRCTASGMWSQGARLNLERALKVGDELGGHIVTGHVDAVGQIAAITAEGDSKRFTFQIPASVAPYVAPKGSICLNGASLTVNEVSDDDLGHWFTVNIIPHTAEWTTFGTAKASDEVNIEIDVLARYLFRMNQLKS